ncbi:response regulator transcription factor [Rhodococcus erythropolis]|uniref:response regulator transcription factor n=1 Tax=Rhodococcus erythropolis TaxID=1833 RepID=UPI0037A46127
MGIPAVEKLADRFMRSGSSEAARSDRRVEFAEFGSDELPDELVVQVLDLHRRIRACAALPESVGRTDCGAAHSNGSLRRTSSALACISAAWDSTVRALSTPSGSAHSTELIALINRLRALEGQIHLYWSRTEAEAESRAVDAIGNLYRCKSLDAVIYGILVEVAGLGFDRVLFSSASGDKWVPRAAYCPTNPLWSQQYLNGLHDAYDLPDAAARLQTAQVDDRDMLHHRSDDQAFELWRRSRSKRFWMIPLSDRGRLMGILHVDCLGDGCGPSRSQFSALRTLGRAVPAIVAHSIARASAPTPMAAIEAGSRDPLASQPNTTGTQPKMEPTLDATDLSARELDVIALMAKGKTNAQIGRRLVITEGTVKSHVKRILRKTDSANRAEAVVKWLQGIPKPSAA